MKLNKPVFSIVIPAFNRSLTIESSIKSVVNQTNSNWELIIVDDGSTDDLFQTIKPFTEVDTRIKYFYQKNQGVSSARNLGVTQSSGDYLIFLDSDDTLEPDLLECLTKEEFYKYDLISWPIKRIVDGNAKVEKVEKLDSLHNFKTVNFFAGSICYKTKIFQLVGGFNEKLSFGENYELGIRICNLEPLYIKIMEKPFLNYYINSLERTSNSIPNRLSSLFTQYKDHKEKYLGDKFLHARLYYFFGYLFEKSSRSYLAKKFYLKAWRIRPQNIKYFLKFLILEFRWFKINSQR